MMKAVVEELGKYPEYNLFLSPCAGTKEQIENLGYQTIDYPFKHVTDYRGFEIFYYCGFFLKYLRKQYRGKFPVNKIDAILDVSGFAYSDQWGTKAVKNVNKLMAFFKKRNVKYIFLPQAFGSFSSNEIREGMKKAIDNCNLIIARDKDSYRMLTEIVENEKIKLYPDITIKVKNIETVIKDVSNYSCVVPNERMLDQGREYWPDGKYLEYINNVIYRLLAETNHNILLLIHDKGVGDTNLAHSLKRNFPNEDRVIVYYEDDTMKLKSILGQANMVIGSRFHALVSALSQNVPSMALGWSHKYKMLFDDYGIGDFTFDKPNDELFDNVLHSLLKDDSRKEILNSISMANLTLEKRNKEMWSEVIKTLSL